MILLAWRGDEAAARAAGAELASLARERRLGWTAARVDAALATLVRGGKISRKLAEARSSTPEELGRLLGADAFGASSLAAA